MAVFFFALFGLPIIAIFSIAFALGNRPLASSLSCAVATGLISWLIFWIGSSALTRSWDKFAGNLLVTLGPVLLTTIVIGVLGIGTRRLISFAFGG